MARTWRSPTGQELSALTDAFWLPTDLVTLEVADEKYKLYLQYTTLSWPVLAKRSFSKYWCAGGPLHGTLQCTAMAKQYELVNGNFRQQFVDRIPGMKALLIHESLLPPVRKKTHEED